MAFYRGPRIVTSGLVLALDAANPKSYAYGSTLWNNLSGNLNSGSLINAPALNNDSYGSLVFNGTDQYINTQGSILPIGTGDYCVDAWIKRTTNPANVSVGICAGVDNNSFYFGFGRTYNGADGLRIGKSNIADAENCAFTFIQNTWYHVAVVRVSSVVYFYINGQQQITQGSGTSAFAFLQSTTARIGSGGNASTILEPLYGSISSVKIYNRALSAAEIAQNYNAIGSRFQYPLANISTYLTLTQAAGLSIYDNTIENTTYLARYSSYASASAFALVNEPII